MPMTPTSAEIRITDTGEVVSESQFRTLVTSAAMAEGKQLSFPSYLTDEMVNEFGGERVLPTPAPAVGRFQSAHRSGVEQDALGNWVFAWKVNQWTAEQISAFFKSDKAAKLATANAQCDTRINAMTASYPATELLTFGKQEMEARAFIADALAATPLLNALSSKRGVAKTELANRIIAKADAFAAYTGAVVGRRQALEDALAAAKTQADLDAIDPASGWPV